MKKDEFLEILKQKLKNFLNFKKIYYSKKGKESFFCIELNNFKICFYPLSANLILNKNFYTEYKVLNNHPLTIAEEKQKDFIIKLVELLYFKKGGLQWDKSVPMLDWEKLTSLSDQEFKKVKNIKEVFEVNTKDKEVVRFFLRINQNCNQECIFCPIDNSQKQKVDINYLKIIINKINTVYPAVNKNFIISGGEPLLHPNYIELINYIIKNKKSGITIQTNASLLDKPKFYEPFSKNKHVNYFISFHSHREDIYDLLSSTQNKYSKVVKGIINILTKTKNWVTINCVVNSYNFPYIDDYINFLKDKFAAIRPISMYLSSVSLNKQGRDDYLIKFSEAVPKLVEIIENKSNKNLHFQGFQGICGFPLCFLQYYPKYFHFNELEEIEERVKPTVCSRCLYNKNCPGLIIEYIEKFGVKELKPIITKIK